MVFKKLPRAVTVKKKTYSISYEEQVEEGHLAGQCHHDLKKMEIALDQKPDEIESTVIHEILHAIAYEYRFPLSEKSVLRLEKAIYETFRANGWKINIQGGKK